MLRRISMDIRLVVELILDRYGVFGEFFVTPKLLNTDDTDLYDIRDT